MIAQIVEPMTRANNSACVTSLEQVIEYIHICDIFCASYSACVKILVHVIVYIHVYDSTRSSHSACVTLLVQVIVGGYD